MEVRTVEQEIKEVEIRVQVPMTVEKLVHVPSPPIVKYTEKIVPVVKEVPRFASCYLYLNNLFLYIKRSP